MHVMSKFYRAYCISTMFNAIGWVHYLQACHKYVLFLSWLEIMNRTYIRQRNHLLRFSPWITVRCLASQSNGQGPWWRHSMETFSALLAFCAGNSPVTGELPSQRPVTRSFDVFFYLRLNKLLSKQSWGWWFGTPSCPLWHQCKSM